MAKRAKERTRKDPPRSSSLLTVQRPGLARVLGISLRQVAVLEAEGLIEPTVRGKGGRPSAYDLTAVVPRYLAHVASTGKASSPHDARSRRDTATARFTEMKTAELEGTLVPRDEVVRKGQAYTKTWSTLLRTLPRRMVVAGTIARDQERAVAQHFNDLIDEIGQWKTVDDADASMRRSQQVKS